MVFHIFYPVKSLNAQNARGVVGLKSSTPPNILGRAGVGNNFPKITLAGLAEYRQAPV